MDLVGLKAQAYDILVNIEMLQGRLRQINEAISNELKKQKEKDVKDDSKEPSK